MLQTNQRKQQYAMEQSMLKLMHFFPRDYSNIIMFCIFHHEYNS